MASDWIMMRMNLADDPAVISIANTLKLDEDTVVGKLHRFWSWFNAQSRDGHAPSVTETWLDRKLGAKGFTAALVSVGWLIVDPSGITLPNFDRWNGSTAKSRGLATRRQQVSRSERDKCHGDSVTKPSPEKRREENKEGSDVFSQIPNRTTAPKTARHPSEDPKQNPPNDPLLAHVESCVAKSMRRNPPELLFQRNEPQKVQAALAEWKSKYPPTINVHNGGCDLDEMIRRAATHAEGAELGGQVGGVLAWIDSTIDGCIRGEVWPGEFRKAAKPKPASRSHLNNGRTW